MLNSNSAGVHSPLWLALTILSTILVYAQIIVDLIYNNSSVYYNSCTFHYSTVYVILLYP